MRLHFVGDGLLDLRRERNRATGRRCRLPVAGYLVIRWRSIRCIAGCRRVGCRLRRIRRLQIRRNQIIREPECCRRVHRIGSEISAVIAVPRRSAPAPAPINRRRPGVIRPSIKSGVVPVRVVVAVVVVTTPAVAHINSGSVGTMVVVRPRIIGASATRDISALHVAAVSAHTHHPYAVARAHDRAPAAESIMNLHPVPIDRPDLPIGPNTRRPAASQRNRTARSYVAAGRRTVPARRSRSTCRVRSRSTRRPRARSTRRPRARSARSRGARSPGRRSRSACRRGACSTRCGTRSARRRGACAARGRGSVATGWTRRRTTRRGCTARR